MAAGHLQFLLETHANLEQLASEYTPMEEVAVDASNQSIGQGAGHIHHPPGSAASVSAVLQSIGLKTHNKTASNGLKKKLSAAAAAAAEGTAAAIKAAGTHTGLVPFLAAMVHLIDTRHPLLELRGARGIARACYSAAAGAVSSAILLQVFMEAATCRYCLAAWSAALHMHGVSWNTRDTASSDCSWLVGSQSNVSIDILPSL